MLEARVMQNNLAAALLACTDLHRGAEALGSFLFQAREIPVAAFRALLRAAQHRMHERLGGAYREALGGDALRAFDLTRAVKGEQRARVSHLERALHQHL